MTLRQLAAKYGVSHVTIGKHAKEHNWVKDLKARIAAQTEDKVNKAAFTAVVNTTDPVKQTTETEVVEAVSQQRFVILTSQQRDIARTRRLFGALMDEVEQITFGRQDLFEQIGELLDESGMDSKGNYKKDKINEIYRFVISMPGRVEATKKLSEILEKVVKLERQAYGMDEAENEKSSVEALLDAIAAKRGFK